MVDSEGVSLASSEVVGVDDQERIEGLAELGEVAGDVHQGSKLLGRGQGF